MACKSDSEEVLHITPQQGNLIGSQYGIGLAEVSNRTPQGKSKMRMAFGWVLKAMSKERRELRDFIHDV